jgi:phosphatidylinositol alpha-1,6-mannosyltransferase
VGGIQLLLERLLEHLHGWEHQVITRSAPGRGPMVPTLRARGATGSRSIAELNLRAAVTGRRLRPDIILNGHVITTPGAFAVAAGRGTPIVTYAYADELTHRPAITRLAVGRSAATIAISRYTAGIVRGFAPAGPVDLVMPGFDARHVAPQRDPRPTVLTVARLADEYKGHDVVLRAMPGILRAVPDAQWLVAGDGPLRPSLEATARELGVAHSVRFLGYVSERERDHLLGRAWAFTMPSRLPPRGAGGEGFGIVYLEAAAAGLPVVAGRVAGALDAVDDGRTGLLVDPEDVGQVQGALIRLLTDSGLRESMGAAGPGWAAGFTWQRQADAVDAVLRRELDRARSVGSDYGSPARGR